jgi:hypothetical protein
MKATINSPKIALKRKNKVEEGGASSLRMKMEQENTKNDEGHSGTICNTNSGKGSATSGPNN